MIDIAIIETLQSYKTQLGTKGSKIKTCCVKFIRQIVGSGSRLGFRTFGPTLDVSYNYTVIGGLPLPNGLTDHGPIRKQISMIPWSHLFFFNHDFYYEAKGGTGSTLGPMTNTHS